MQLRLYISTSFEESEKYLCSANNFHISVFIYWCLVSACTCKEKHARSLEYTIRICPQQATLFFVLLLCFHGERKKTNTVFTLCITTHWHLSYSLSFLHPPNTLTWHQNHAHTVHHLHPQGLSHRFHSLPYPGKIQARAVNETLRIWSPLVITWSGGCKLCS